MSLDSAISAAVDTAVGTVSAPESPSGGTSAGGSTTPSAPESGPTLPEAPAAPSGFEGAAAESSSSDASTRRTSAPAVTPESPTGGEPPPAKWPTVLENARVKERELTRSQVFEQYGLADGLDPVEVRAHLNLLQRDPQLHAELTLQALKRDGTYRRREGESPDSMIDEGPPPLPDPALVSVDGQRAYTADQVHQVVMAALMQFRQQLSGELQPLQTMHQQARVAAIRADAQTYAGEAVREASTWHRFAELKDRVREIMVSDKRTTLLSAYNRALQEDLKNSTTQIKAETRRQTLDEIKQASESNTIRPGAAAVARSGTREQRGGLDARLDRAINAALTSTAAR